LLHAIVEQMLAACDTLACLTESDLLLQILMFPSKSDGMFMPESLIFRSDSNSEDLEGYAGAGLYDFITMAETELKKVDYNGDRYDSCTLHTLFATASFVITVKNSFVIVSGLSSRGGPYPMRKM